MTKTIDELAQEVAQEARKQDGVSDMRKLARAALRACGMVPTNHSVRFVARKAIDLMVRKEGA